MEKYLKALELMKKDGYGFLYNFLPRLEKYIMGEIDLSTLKLGADSDSIRELCFALNKILNYEDNEISYFIPVPNDMYLDVRGKKCIAAAKPRYTNTLGTCFETIGPKDFKSAYSGFYENYYFEIKGDFSSFPNGTMLSSSDYLKIILRYPHIIDILKYLMRSEPFGSFSYLLMSDDKLEAEAISIIDSKKKEAIESNGDFSDGEQSLSQEVIDSITFVVPAVYVTLDELLFGNSFTFEELVGRKNKNVVLTNTAANSTPSVLDALGESDDITTPSHLDALENSCTGVQSSVEIDGPIRNLVKKEKPTC